MSVVGVFSRNITGVRVTTHKQDIIIDGVSGRLLAADITRHWATSKVSKNIFTQIQLQRISFRAFFLMDVYYILQTLQTDGTTRTPRRVLAKIISLLKTNTWLRDLDQPIDWSKHVRNVDKILKWKPLDWQRELLVELVTNSVRYNLTGYILAAPPGTGKTFGALYCAESLGVDAIVVVAPKKAIYDVWDSTLSEVYHDTPRTWVSGRGHELDTTATRFVFHYEELAYIDRLAPQLLDKRVVVVLDESHNLNNIQSARTTRLVEFVKTIKPVMTLWTSGTPLSAMGTEMIPFLHTATKDFTKDVQDRFTKIYGASKSNANDILRNRIGVSKYQIEKSDVVRNESITSVHQIKLPNGNDYTLPAISKVLTAFIADRKKHYDANHSVYLERYEAGVRYYERTIEDDDASLQALAVYKRYVQQIIADYDPIALRDEIMYCNSFETKTIAPVLPKEMRRHFLDARSVIKYVRLKIVGEALGRVLTKMRVECNLDLLHYVPFDQLIDPSEAKSILFTSHVEVVEEANSLLTAAGYKPVMVYADTNKNLSAIRDEFTRNPDINPLIATYKSLSEAVPMTMANTVVLLNAPFRDRERIQAVSRVDRIGQVHPVRIHEIYLDTGNVPNISTRSREILEWSRQQVEEILGVSIPEVATESQALMPTHLYTASEDIGQSLGLPPDTAYIEH